jgi:hypothetical protein
VAIRAGEGGAVTVHGGATLLGSKSGVRNEVLLLLPPSFLGDADVHQGQRVRLDVALSTRGHAYREGWSGEWRLGS